MLTGDKLVERLLAAGIAKAEEIIGCTEQDLRDIAQHAPGPLPFAYLDFLHVVGRGAGHFLPEQDVYFPKMLRLTEEAKAILDNWEKGLLLLPVDAFVCTMRYGDQFLFFHADGKSENPQLHHYLIGQGHFRPVATFWGWVDEELQLTEQFYHGAAS